MNSGLIKNVTVQPIKESMEGLKTDVASLRSILDSHFDEFSSESKWRSAWKGQILTVKTGMGREAMFKITQCDDGVYVNINGGTNLTVGPPISDDDAMKQFNEVGYSDIGGLKDQLDKIREVVELPIRHPTLFRRIGVRPPKGVLMHGPPGCGKTTVCKILCCYNRKSYGSLLPAGNVHRSLLSDSPTLQQTNTHRSRTPKNTIRNHTRIPYNRISFVRYISCQCYGNIDGTSKSSAYRTSIGYSQNNVQTLR